MRRLVLSSMSPIVVVATLSALVSACKTEPKQSPPHSSQAAQSSEGAQFIMPTLGGERTRSHYVAEADRLALQASKQQGQPAHDLYRQAALLRHEAFIQFGKQVDALEAVELLKNLPADNTNGSCDSTVLTLELQVALGKDPMAQYRDLFLLRERATDPVCRQRLSRALAVLSAYQLPAQELTKIRDEARLLAPAASSAVPSIHESSVVTPDVLRANLDQPTKITSVEPFAAERTARVVVHVTHPTRFRVGTLQAGDGQGPRLFVDIDRASYEHLETIQSKGLLERVRFGKADGGARVVLDLTQPTFHRVFYLPEPFRLVIDLSLDAPSARTQSRKLRRLVLDPGHGGHDPGAVGPNGLQEKDVALDIAHRAAPLLAREAGVSTLLTRDVDVFVPLDERAARANAFHADLFVSIHLNSNPDHASRGVMTFVLDASHDAAASKVAARENASTEAAAVELANALSRVDSVARRESSELFASLLQRAAGASLRQRYDDVLDSGVRKAGFYVLAGAAMPSVLFEGSFISNPIEADRLNQADYRQRLADSIVNAVRAYQQGL